jgi:iron complex transport system substrate-binding protein
MILTLAYLVGAADKGEAVIARLEGHLEAIRTSASSFPFRPRVFFEEWNNPLISGICWVDELVEIAGGDPVFSELRSQKNAPGRIVDPAQVIPKNPQVIIASWCGAKVNKKAIRSRPGWTEMAAVRDDHIYEVKSTYILQPGPASLTEGVRQLHTILAHVAGSTVPAELACEEKVDPALQKP